MSLMEAGPKETVKRDYGQELVSWSERALVGNLRQHRASHVGSHLFLPDAPYLDVITTTGSLQAQEMTALEAVEVADMKVLIV